MKNKILILVVIAGLAASLSANAQLAGDILVPQRTGTLGFNLYNTGPNASHITIRTGTAVLTTGTATVTDAGVTPNSFFYFTGKGVTNAGSLGVGTIVSSTNFSVSGSNTGGVASVGSATSVLITSPTTGAAVATTSTFASPLNGWVLASVGGTTTNSGTSGATGTVNGSTVSLGTVTGGNATNALNIPVNPTANDTFVIGSLTYTFVTSVTTTNQILIGNSVAQTIANTVSAINNTTTKVTVADATYFPFTGTSFQILSSGASDSRTVYWMYIKQ